MIYFIADTHFNHRRIIEYCNRPFTSIEEMNETIISNWNSIVKPEDIVYHLGDFALIWKGDTSYIDILKRLNGEIYLILGNHDNKIDKSLFKSCYEYANRLIPGNNLLLPLIPQVGINIIMTHLPYKSHGLFCLDTLDNSIIYLHGHTHGTLPDTHNVYDVGVDNNNFYPVTIEEIQERL